MLAVFGRLGRLGRLSRAIVAVPAFVVDLSKEAGKVALSERLEGRDRCSQYSSVNLDH